MEVSSALANNANSVRQAVSLAMMRKTMGLDANVVSELLPEVAATVSNSLERSVNPDVGGNIDVSV